MEKLINQLGIDVYFTVTGGAIAPFVDAVRDRVVFFQHEQAAVMAAEGYYRTCGKIAAVLVTSGPGIQNTLNGVCGCWYDSIPCLVISGQVNVSESLLSVSCTPRQVGFQEMPVVDMFKHCTVFCEQIKNTNDVSRVFSEALSRINSNRKGPAVIDFPVNIQMSDFDVDIKQFSTLPLSSHIDFDKIPIEKRPLVVVGNGARGCDRTKLSKWLDNVPFVCTWAAKDILPKHPMNIGCHGVYGDRYANFALQNADSLVILGSRFDTRQTGGKLDKCSEHSKSRRTMVDIDANEINKLSQRGFTIDYPHVCTVEEFINRVPPIESSMWMKCDENDTEETRGDVYKILKDIKLEDDVIIIPDCGGNLVWAMQSFDRYKNRIFTNLGNSSMGYSVPAAIGAAIASNGKTPVLCIIGDGGIQMNIQELYTIQRLNLPITILVINNRGYGIIRQFQDSYLGQRHVAVDMDFDIQKISNAYGIPSSPSESHEIVIRRDGPFLYDVRIDPNERLVPKLEFGNTLENMTPHRPDLIEKYMTVKPNDFIQTQNWKTHLPTQVYEVRSNR